MESIITPAFVLIYLPGLSLFIFRYTGLKNLGTLKPSPSDTEKLKSLVATIKEAIQLIKTSTVVLQGGDEDEDGSGSGTGML